MLTMLATYIITIVIITHLQLPQSTNICADYIIPNYLWRGWLAYRHCNVHICRGGGTGPADQAAAGPIITVIPEMEIVGGFSIYRNLIIKFNHFY